MTPEEEKKLKKDVKKIRETQTDMMLILLGIALLGIAILFAILPGLLR